MGTDGSVWQELDPAVAGMSATVVVVAAAIVIDGKLLAACRSAPPELAGRWELPGGKVESGESDVDALVREIREELGVEVIPTVQVGGDWPLDTGVMRVWRVSAPADAKWQLLDQQSELRWVSAEDLMSVDWIPADIAPARAILGVNSP